MATTQAIAVVGSSLAGLLEDACPRETFPAARFRVLRPADLDTSQLPFSEGVSFTLFRTSFNTLPRRLPPRTDALGIRYQPSLPLDLHYLVVAWATDVLQQHRLLAWTARTLEDNPLLPAGFLNRFAAGSGDVFGPEETVDIVGENPSLPDWVNIWEPAKQRQQPGLVYVVRRVLIDSELELTEAGRVQTRVPAMGLLSEAR